MVELSDIKDEITKAWNKAKEESGFEFRAICTKYAGYTNVDQHIQKTIVDLKDYRDNGGLGNLYINTYPKPNFFDDSKTDLYHIGKLSDDNLSLIANYYYNYYKNHFSDCSSDETVKNTSYRSCYGFFVKIQTVKRLLDLLDKVKEKKENLNKEINKNISLPNELDTDDAKALFQKFIVKGLCKADGSLYKWEGSPSLFGYFVDEVSKKLDVRPSSDRIPWKFFRKAFQCDKKTINTARQAVNDYKNKGLSKPENYLDVKNLCK